MKKIITVLIIVIVLLFALGVTKDFFIKRAVQTVGSHVLGVPVKIGGLSFGIISRFIKIKDLRIYHPEGFPDGILLDIPLIKVKYDLDSLLKKKIHLPEVVFNLEEVNIIKNKEGKLNVDSLKISKKKKTASKDEKLRSQSPMKIDLLVLTIGRAVITDYTKGEKPSVEVFDVGVKDKTIKNITSAQQLTGVVLMQAMKDTTIKGAAIYGVAAVAGAAFLPAGVAVALTGRNSTEKDFNADYDKVFDTALLAVKEIGEIASKDRSGGMIRANVSGSNVTVRIMRNDDGTSKLTVSARKFLIPKPEISQKVLGDISEKLK